MADVWRIFTSIKRTRKNWLLRLIKIIFLYLLHTIKIEAMKIKQINSITPIKDLYKRKSRLLALLLKLDHQNKLTLFKFNIIDLEVSIIDDCIQQIQKFNN